MLLKIIKQYWWPIFLAILCVAVNIFSNNNQRVEQVYSTNLYVKFATIYRAIFAWVPFSMGDILYGIVLIYLIYKAIKFIKIIFSKAKRKQFLQDWKIYAISLFKKLASVYLLFNVLWGINYNRIGIAAQLDLKIEKFSLEELKEINLLLVEKINSNKTILLSNKITEPNAASIFVTTKNAYDSASKKYSFLNYKNVSIKKSIYSWFCNYASIDGYYNPFTAEANINTTVPTFTQPFTTCHEVAHQLGYAKEMEANFVGFISATASNDTYFKYSTYTDLFMYANNTLLFADSASARVYRKMLLPEVINDFKVRRKFSKDHVGKLEPIIKILYGKFLEQNEQPMGILSYDEVTAFIIAYYKKFNDL